MNIFSDQIKFLRLFQERLIFESFKDALEKNGLILKDLIVEEQLYKEGIDGKGKKLKGYSRFTIRIKISKGQPVDRTTLQDEKDFVNSITVDSKEDEFSITSDVTHDKYIIKKYGKDVLSPTTENMKDFLEDYFLPKLKENVDNEISK